MALQVASSNGAAIMDDVIAKGDLSKLQPEQRARYYGEVCRSMGLNPLTQPFEYITLNGKLTLYARRTAADQLRKLNQVNVRVTDRTVVNDVLVVTVEATDREGRTDTDIGAVAVGGLKGEAYANAIMKAVTKAKRRVTLSICGLGWLDETEVEAIPASRPVAVDIETGEILDGARSTTTQRGGPPENPALAAIEMDAIDAAIALQRRSMDPEADDAGEADNRRFTALHAAIAAAGHRNGSGFAGNLPHQIAHDLGAGIFGVGSLKDLSGEQLYQLRKRIEQLDAAGVGAAWQEAKQTLAGTLPGTPAPVADRGEPGMDRYSN